MHANPPTRQKALAIATPRNVEHVRNATLMVSDLQSGICCTLPQQLSAYQPSPLLLQHYRYHLLASGFNGNIIKGMQSMT